MPIIKSWTWVSLKIQFSFLPLNLVFSLFSSWNECMLVFNLPVHLNLLRQFSSRDFCLCVCLLMLNKWLVYAVALMFKMPPQKDPDKFFMSISNGENKQFDYLRALYGKCFSISVQDCVGVRIKNCKHMILKKWLAWFSFRRHYA